MYYCIVMSENAPGFDGVKPEVSSNLPQKIETQISVDRANATACLIEEAINDNGGKIPYSKFMDISVFGPEGYYSSGKARIGRDFMTNPEVSEYFGATVGNSTKKVWEAMGRPEHFDIVEMGAGNGTLAKDMLVWARETDPAFYEALSYTIVEYGDLIEKQQETISGKRPLRAPLTAERNAQDLKKIRWVRGSALTVDLHDIEGVIVSNELLDAFPTEIVSKRSGKIRQKYISIENNQWVERWDEPSGEVTAYISDYGIAIDEGKEEPINLLAAQWQKHVDAMVKKGAIITLDYGQDGIGRMSHAVHKYPKRFPDALPEYRSPGNIDITTNVNFAVLKQVAERDGLSVAYNGGQTDYLYASGISEVLDPIMSEARSTKSIKRLCELLDSYGLSGIEWVLEKEETFFSQILTKGVFVDFSVGERPSVQSLFDTGFRLKMEKPNASYHIVNQKYGSSNTVQSDADCYISFTGTTINPLVFFSKYSHCAIKEEEGEEGRVIVDTDDKDALKQLVERSGYEYDLAA